MKKFIRIVVWGFIILAVALVVGLKGINYLSKNYSDKGDALYNAGKFEDSLVFYNKSIASFENEYNLNQKGLALYSLGRYQEAIKYFDDALSHNQDNNIILYNKGKALFYLGEYKEADKYYYRALSLYPTNVKYLEARGNVLYKLLKYQEAIKYFDDALKIEPTNINILFSKCKTIFVSVEDLRESSSCFNNLLSIEFDDLGISSELFGYLNILGKYEDALIHIDKVLKVVPEKVEVLYIKLQILENLERKEEAKKIFDKINEINPNYIFSQESKKEE